jgi:hypothetical protein
MFDGMGDGRDIHFSSDNDYCYWYLMFLILVLRSSSADSVGLNKNPVEPLCTLVAHKRPWFPQKFYRAWSGLHPRIEQALKVAEMHHGMDSVYSLPSA